MCARSRTVESMLLLRLVLSVVQLGLVVAVSVWWSNLQDDCFDSSEELTRLGWTTFGLAWVSLGLTLGFLLAVHRPVSTLTPVEFWASVLQKQMCLCCWRHCDPVLREEEPDLFDKIAEPFAQVFDVDGVVMGDVATGMFLVKAAHRAAIRGLAPLGMRATGVRPEARRVVFAHRPTLHQDLTPAHHKDGNGLVPQPLLMGTQLVHRGQGPVNPCGDQIWTALGHVTPEDGCAKTVI